jgi:hypothetical protein
MRCKTRPQVDYRHVPANHHRELGQTRAFKFFGLQGHVRGAKAPKSMVPFLICAIPPPDPIDGCYAYHGLRTHPHRRHVAT